MNAESGSRALNAVNDLVELLRLSQGAAERLEQEVHGASFEQADLIARDLHRLRRLAEKLQADIERYVSREETAAGARGHPLRRASDRGLRI
jgi:signal transduction histidine kinase